MNGVRGAVAIDPVVERVLRLFADWGESYEALCQSLRDNFSADCVWENPGCPTTVGAQDAIDRVVNAGRDESDLATIGVQIDRLTYLDGLLWTERRDDLFRSDGSLIISTPVVGVMEIDESGRIRAWREFSKHDE